MNIKNNPSINTSISIGLILIFCFYQYNLKAQIGSIGGFNTINLSQKNDLVFSLGGNFSKSLSNLNAYDIQAAYAFNSYLGAQLGYHNFSIPHFEISDLCESKNCKRNYDNRLFNIAIGSFFSYDLKKSLFLQNQKRNYQYASKINLLFEAYLSYGKSKNVKNYFSSGLPDILYPRSLLKFDSYQIQTNFSYNGNFSGFNFSAMYGIIDFNKISIFGNIPQDFVNVLATKSLYPVYGVHFKIWVGVKQIKLLYSINRKTFLDKNDSFSNINTYFGRAYNRNYLRQLTVQINLAYLKIKKKT